MAMSRFHRGCALLVPLSCFLAQPVRSAVAPTAPPSTEQAVPSLLGPNVFPIAVWLQPPSKAVRYREAGFNLYVGLWQGPKDSQLAELKAAGMRVVCDQNAVGLRHLADPTIAAWMHGDEPDNAQSLGEGKGWGPPIPAERIVADYEAIRRRDPSRPVLLNLGQGVAWDEWYGRGVRSRHPEDYLEYVKGADIVSFDIYPVTHDSPAVSSNLWFVARGVTRLNQWTGGRKGVWNCIECTRISHPTAKPTPQHVRAEVWMSIIHGSRGLIYFVHEWKPRFNESALLDDPEMLAAVTRINQQVQELAPVLNAPATPGLVRLVAPAAASTSADEASVACMAREHGGVVYVFAVNMRAEEVEATFELDRPGGVGSVEVLGEQRAVPVSSGRFKDGFRGWDVHLYRLGGKPSN